MTPLRVMFDTHVFDLVVADPAVLTVIASDPSPVVVVTTHVQNDELAAAPHAIGHEAVRAEEVPSMGFVLGFSRLDHARLAEPGDYEAIVGSTRAGKHSCDALIGATAKQDADVLVTNDVRLTKRARSRGVEVWDWDGFRAWLLATETSGGNDRRPSR